MARARNGGRNPPPVSPLTSETGLPTSRAPGNRVPRRTPSPEADARTLGIEFFWLDHDDHATASATMRRFAERPDLFTPVFGAGDVHIYRVN